MLSAGTELPPAPYLHLRTACLIGISVGVVRLATGHVRPTTSRFSKSYYGAVPRAYLTYIGGDP